MDIYPTQTNVMNLPSYDTINSTTDHHRSAKLEPTSLYTAPFSSRLPSPRHPL